MSELSNLEQLKKKFFLCMAKDGLVVMLEDVANMGAADMPVEDRAADVPVEDGAAEAPVEDGAEELPTEDGSEEFLLDVEVRRRRRGNLSYEF